MPPPWSKTGMTSAARNFSWTVDQNAGSKLYEESFAKYNLDRQKLLTLLQEFFPKHVFKDGEPIVGLPLSPIVRRLSADLPISLRTTCTFSMCPLS